MQLPTTELTEVYNVNQFFCLFYADRPDIRYRGTDLRDKPIHTLLCQRRLLG